MLKIAIYGKGGIGKSTTTQNLTAGLAELGKKVMVVGCDPKADSTRCIMGRKIPTVLDRVLNENSHDFVFTGYNGILCIESGGPEPGTGCAGKGIATALHEIQNGNILSDRDVVIYDVLGDVVCGGFAVPMRPEHSDALLIVTSGEYMSLFAANNILKGSLNFQDDKGRIAGLVLNRRGLVNEDGIVEEFSRATNVPILCHIGRSDIFRQAETEGLTVSELFPGSEESEEFCRLGEFIVNLSELHLPTPLTDEQLDTLYSTGHCLGTGSFVPEERIKKDVNGSVPVITAPRRIGKGPVSAVLEAGKISDIPVVIHGTSSCGYTMLNEVSDERMNHIISDPEAFVSSGDNICCTGMTSDGAVFGGTSALQALLTELVKNNRIVLIISTCLSGMIGDDCRSVIDRITKENPDVKLLFVDANRVDSGFDAHVEVIRSLIELIDTGVEPLQQYVNVVDDSFIEFNKGDNRRNLETILSGLDMMNGPGFLNDCVIDEIMNLRRYGIHVLADGRRDNLLVKEKLQSKGIHFMENVLPRGFEETLEWLDELANITGDTSRTEQLKLSIIMEMEDTVSRYYPDLSRLSVDLTTYSVKEDGWIARTLSKCGCTVTIHTFLDEQRMKGFNCTPHGSKQSMRDSLSGDIIIDCVGVTDGSAIGRPDTWLSHIASVNLIRRVWAASRSDRDEKWRTWGD